MTNKYSSNAVKGRTFLTENQKKYPKMVRRKAIFKKVFVIHVDNLVSILTPHTNASVSLSDYRKHG